MLCIKFIAFIYLKFSLKIVAQTAKCFCSETSKPLNPHFTAAEIKFDEL